MKRTYYYVKYIVKGAEAPCDQWFRTKKEAEEFRKQDFVYGSDTPERRILSGDKIEAVECKMRCGAYPLWWSGKI